MEIQGNAIVGGKLIGQVKSQDGNPSTELVKEVELLMNKYEIDYMWFAWSKFGGGSKDNQRRG